MQDTAAQLAERSERDADSIAPSRSLSPFAGWEEAASRGLIVVVASVLAWYTWAHWGDIQVDCGRELYVPAEILRGKLLYRDIFYPYGPLAPYASALLIAVFGPHLLVFYLFGIAVAIGCALLLFELGTMLESRACGLTAALALLLLGYEPTAFNYVFPYSYAATLGLLLSLLCARFMVRYLLDGSGQSLVIAGMAASVTLLDKQEFGIACYIMLAFVIAIEALQQRSMRQLLRGIGACAPGVVLWVAIYGWFFWTLTPTFMIQDNWLGPGTYFMQTYGAHLYWDMGQRFVPSEMVVLAVCAALTLALWFSLAKVSRPLRGVALAILMAIAAVQRFDPMNLATRILTIFLVFPVGMFFIGCGFVAYSTYESIKKGDRRRLAEAAFGILALLPAVRVFAAIQLYVYSIYYAVPLFLVFAITIARLIKAAVPTTSDERRRMLVNSLLAAEVAMLALIAIPVGNTRTSKLETTWGEIYLTPEDADVARQIIDFMSEQRRLGRLVDVVPEAPMLYAFAGSEAPNRWYTLTPGFLSPSQEDDYIEDLSRKEPAYIVITARNNVEHGAPYFGLDYDKKLYRWIEANYRVDREFGRFRRDGSRVFVALLYRRIDPVERKSTRAINSDRPG